MQAAKYYEEARFNRQWKRMSPRQKEIMLKESAAFDIYHTSPEGQIPGDKRDECSNKMAEIRKKYEALKATPKKTPKMRKEMKDLLAQGHALKNAYFIKNKK